MNIHFLTTSQSALWDDVLAKMPNADVYHSAGYHRAHEANGDGCAYLFVAEDGESILCYPFMLREILEGFTAADANRWYDIETVYGYTGPLSTSRAPFFLRTAWSLFSDWCRDNRVVAEFTRFHPLLDNHRLMDSSCQVTLERETVKVCLEGDEKDLWASYPPGHRSKIRKAQKRGLVCRPAPMLEGLTEFRRLYQETMESVSADKYYLFSDNYFRVLAEELAGRIILFVVEEEGRTVAAGLFLYSGPYLHYHLGGSDVTSRDARPNNLLFHTAACWGMERGTRWLHLGGGRTPRSDDSLLRFKASISDLRCAFYIGMRIHNLDQYNNLCNTWLLRHGLVERPRYFLTYRLATPRSLR